MLYVVYVLFSERDGGLYVGCTSDMTARFTRHMNGTVVATRYRRPLHLIHTEEFADKAAAFQRERFLKSLWGAREKQKIKKRFLSSRG